MYPTRGPNCDNNGERPFSNVDRPFSAPKHPINDENMQSDTANIMRQPERQTETTSHVSPPFTSVYGEDPNRGDEVEIIDLADDESESEEDDGNQETTQDVPLMLTENLLQFIRDSYWGRLGHVFNMDNSYQNATMPIDSPMEEDVGDLDSSELEYLLGFPLTDESDDLYSDIAMDSAYELPSEDQIVTIMDEPDEDETADRQSLVNKARSDQSTYCCPICTDPPIRPVCTICGHIYCAKCMRQLFRRPYREWKCPLCTKPLTKRDVHPIFF